MRGLGVGYSSTSSTPPMFGGGKQGRGVGRPPAHRTGTSSNSNNSNNSSSISGIQNQHQPSVNPFDNRRSHGGGAHGGGGGGGGGGRVGRDGGGRRGERRNRGSGLGLVFRTYNVLPVGRDLGLLEMVPNAETLFSITRERKEKLLHFLMRHNGSQPCDKVCADTCTSWPRRYAVVVYGYDVVVYVVVYMVVYVVREV